METRASFVVIGMFTISVIVGVFLFVLWLAQVEIDREFARYDVIFETPVTGLSKGGEVHYSGIKVGEVKELFLDPKNPSRVIARVQVDARTPVSTDTAATLEFWGLTGVSYIQLSGGGPESTRLVAEDDEDVPTIVATPSVFQSLYASAPEILSGANEVILLLKDVLREENRESVSNALQNIDDLTASLATRSDEIAKMIDSTANLTQDLADADIDKMVQEAQKTAEALTELANTTNSVLLENSAAFRNFSETGLAGFGSFVAETRELVRTLDRVLAGLESDPARYISGNHVTEYEPQ